MNCCHVSLDLTIIMATSTTTTANTSKPNKIKVFQFIQTLYKRTGIYPSQTDQNCLLNAKALVFILSVVLFSIASIAFLLFKAKCIGDQAYSYCVSLTAIFVYVCIMKNSLKIPKILILIEEFDKFICKSRLKNVDI